MEHVWEKHTNCEEQSCMICDGGLAVCTVCGLAEGCLTTDCPGEPAYKEYADRVHGGGLDFVEPMGWVQRPRTGPPAGMRERAGGVEL